MAYGIKRLRKLQIGREATAGTAVAATEIWRGPANIVEDQRVRTFTEEDIGQLDPLNRFYDSAYLAQFPMPGQPATFEQLAHIFEAGIDTIAGVRDGTGPYVYGPYVLNDTTNAIKAYTLEGGDNSDAVEAEYCFVSEFVLSGKVDEAVMIDSAMWMGRQVADTTFTADLVPIAVEEILFNEGKLYLNDTAATIGNTEKAGSLLGFRLSVTTGWVATRGANGLLTFYGVKNVGGVATLELTLEHDTLATAERVLMRTGAPRFARLQFDGSAISGGSTWTGKALRLDFEGVWMPESFRTLSDENGDDIVTGTLRHGKSADGVGVQLSVVNARATL
jgi:hypothetical protein